MSFNWVVTEMKRLLLTFLVLAIGFAFLSPTSGALAADTASIRIQNKTGAQVSLTFTGVATYRFNVSTGKSTIEMIVGQYRYSYEACGETRTGKLNLKAQGTSLALPKCPNKNQSQGRGGCHQSYPTVCIPPRPPDLDCKDIPYRYFPVRGGDPHNFDSDHDGIGCESR